MIDYTPIAYMDTSGLVRAAQIIRRGGTVAFATETVYGLGADACQDRAVLKIYAAKGRPRFNPLIAHFPDLTSARGYAHFSPLASALAETFWPGPLTLVLPILSDSAISLTARAGLDSIAVRVPALASARRFLEMADCPIVAPSANRSGHVSPVCAEHVLHDLAGKIDLILDGGFCSIGLESTIISLLEPYPRILRAGAISCEHISALTGLPVLATRINDAAPIAPGQLSSHYAPSARLRLNALNLLANENGLDFGGHFSAQGFKPAFDLSPSADLFEAAANLFRYLRELDRNLYRHVAVAPIPNHEMGIAINERLLRASL